MLLSLRIADNLLLGCLQKACCDGVTFLVRLDCCFIILSACQDITMHEVLID